MEVLGDIVVKGEGTYIVKEVNGKKYAVRGVKEKREKHRYFDEYDRVDCWENTFALCRLKNITDRFGKSFVLRIGKANYLYNAGYVNVGAGTIKYGNDCYINPVLLNAATGVLLMSDLEIDKEYVSIDLIANEVLKVYVPTVEAPLILQGDTNRFVMIAPAVRIYHANLLDHEGD